MGSEEEVLNMDGTRGSYHSFFKKAVSSTTVLPWTKSPHPDALRPSHLDHLHMDRYVPILFLHRLSDNKDATYQRYVDQLKTSLAKTLVPFYPMAGRVLKTNDPDHPRELRLDDGGVVFSEAFLDQGVDSVINPKDFQAIGYLSGFEPAGLDTFKQIQQYPEEGNPAFFVQVTRFSCGGVVLAVTWNHIVADMTAATQFFAAWSEISRTGRTSIQPNHDRSILSPTPHTSSLSATSPSPQQPQTAAETAKTELVLKTRTLHIRKEAIDEVKREARKEHPQLSTMDCLSAHLWRTLARAYARLGVCETTAFTTAVEGRQRMGVSPTYFGNVVISATVMGVPAVEINSKPLSHAAGLVRGAIRGIGKDSYWTIINQMDLRNPWKTSINRTDYQLALVSWIRFGLYDLDFGYGRPAFVGVNLQAQLSRKGQTIVMPSAKGDGYYDVRMLLPPRVMDALWADPQFTSLS